MNEIELRKRVIRLAHENPSMRKDLLPLIKQADCSNLPEALQENCEKKVQEGRKKEAKFISGVDIGFDEIYNYYETVINKLHILHHRLQKLSYEELQFAKDDMKLSMDVLQKSKLNIGKYLEID